MTRFSSPCVPVDRGFYEKCHEATTSKIHRKEDKEPLELQLGRTRDPAGGVRHVSWHVGDTPRPTEVVGRRSSALEGRAGKQKAQGRTNNSS